MNRNIEALLDRYRQGNTTVEENQLIEKWLAENGVADPAWQRLAPADKEQWLADVLTDVKATIGSNQPVRKLVPSHRYLWYKLAGAAAVLLVVFAVWSRFSGQPALPKDLAVVSIPRDQKKQITLADGSRVWLNAGAELKYPAVFSEKAREVYLSGEAYFDVQHDPAKPFLIHTGKVLTTVLGTAFNIKADKDQQTVEVTVSKGKVSVEDAGKLLGILTSNQQISLDLVSGKFAEKTVNANTVIAWQGNEMSFDDITFADAALQLQQHFHVKISFNNEKLKACRFSGSTLKGDQLDKILDVITGFNNATWQRKPDGLIVIYGDGCTE
ncbi:FecR family protein [Chitinophaga arvensicola]|nr:FecR domain-containing protein [Chitinophaga arvensicola]